MDYRIVWVHGIGTHSPGFSSEWRENFNPYLHLNENNYLEVCWDSVFSGGQGRTRGGETGESVFALTPEEQAAETQVREQLETLFYARSTALQQAQSSQGAARTRGAAEKPYIEWTELTQTRTRGLPTWLVNPDAYIGDFVKYLISRRLRNAVKEKFKEQLRPLAGQNESISVISHSWGTVVAYDSLLDLETEIPALKVHSLITLGSPLWMVRSFLEDKSGRKPGEVETWVNIHAKGDFVGSWLSAGFRVDREFEVLNFGGQDAHGSYFIKDNLTVQKELVPQFVLVNG